MRSMALLLALTLAVGCAYEREPLPVSQAVPPDTPAPAQAATADKAVSDQVLALTGPGGIVRLGDPMEQAKKAFPIPKGAEQDDGPAVFGDSSYSWSHPQTSESFGANGRSGKVAFLAYSLGANAKPEALA
ncbi:MAG TPA: hypothetical protein VM328_05530, partial [Fimbriimonadaceae bacterium]|nr:hypothetical protein [Fimbriimonadaceae bacterium]